MTTESTTPQTEQLLTPEQVGEIEARTNAATREPWRAKIRDWPIGDTGDYEPCADVYAVFGDTDKPRAIGMFHELTLDADAQAANCEFTAHARTDIPALCRTLKAAWKTISDLQNENERLREVIHGK